MCGVRTHYPKSIAGNIRLLAVTCLNSPLLSTTFGFVELATLRQRTYLQHALQNLVHDCDRSACLDTSTQSLQQNRKVKLILGLRSTLADGLAP
jgi:hypothetical protein